jgi:hypothetical protein
MRAEVKIMYMVVFAVDVDRDVGAFLKIYYLSVVALFLAVFRGSCDPVS